MEPLDELFKLGAQRYDDKFATQRSDYEKAIEKARHDFLSPSEAEKQRMKLKADLTSELAQLKAKLRGTKNVKVAGATSINNKRASIRKNLRAKINTIELALKDLELEKEGSKLKNAISSYTPPENAY